MARLSIAGFAALGKFLEEHRPKLLAMVRRRIDPVLRARTDPEDILSEAFLAAQTKWERFRMRGDVSPYAWLYRLTLDCMIEAWRKHTRGPRNPAFDMPFPERSSLQLGLGLVHSGTSPSAAALRGELRDQMRQALELLSARDQEILWMRHYDDLSFKDAAAVLGTSENAATVRYVRALKRLRDVWVTLHGTPE